MQNQSKYELGSWIWYESAAYRIIEVVEKNNSTQYRCRHEGGLVLTLYTNDISLMPAPYEKGTAMTFKSGHTIKIEKIFTIQSHRVWLYHFEDSDVVFNHNQIKFLLEQNAKPANTEKLI